jgi:prepilin-type N-terminal cleavage/methylation domain-containing protein
MRKGFTLIEMSVVLVIIGFLVAGIVIAQSLVRSSRVQTIVTDVATYQGALAQFRQKYSAVAGDMAAAQSTWGVNPNCSSSAGAGTGTQTCNGNGDGQIEVDTSAPYEQFLAWQHLANAGLIQGQFTGTSVSGATAPTTYCSPGVNCPGGKLNQSQAYFIQYSAGALGGSTANFWAQGPGHYLIVGATTTLSASNGYPGYPLISAPEAASLDGKVDDGLPGQGVWKSFEATGGAGYLPKCVVTSGTTTAPADGTLASEPGSVYYVAYGTTPACALEINLSF